MSQFQFLKQASNITAKTAGVKVTGDSTALSSPAVRWTGGSDAGHAGKGAITGEPVGGQKKVVVPAGFQGLNIVGYAVAVATIAGHALKALGQNRMPVMQREALSLGVGFMPAGFA